MYSITLEKLEDLQSCYYSVVISWLGKPSFRVFFKNLHYYCPEGYINYHTKKITSVCHLSEETQKEKNKYQTTLHTFGR